MSCSCSRLTCIHLSTYTYLLAPFDAADYLRSHRHAPSLALPLQFRHAHVPAASSPHAAAGTAQQFEHAHVRATGLHLLHLPSLFFAQGCRVRAAGVLCTRLGSLGSLHEARTPVKDAK